MKFITIVLSLVFSSSVLADYIDDSLRRAAEKEKVPYELLRAVCIVESELRVWAVAYHDGGRDNHAIGLCQVLISTAQQYGWKKDSRCHTKMPREDRKYDNCTLYGPYTNIVMAAKVLKQQLKRYEGSWIAAIAAYNAGSLLMCGKKGYFTQRRDGKKIKCKPEEVMNQKYIDKVVKTLTYPELGIGVK